MYLVSLTIDEKPAATELFDTREQAYNLVDKQIEKIKARGPVQRKEETIDGVEEIIVNDNATFRVMELSYREYTIVEAIIGFVNEYEGKMSGMSGIIGKQMTEKVKKELNKMSDDIKKTL